MRIIAGAITALFLLGTTVPAHAGIFSWIHGGDKNPSVKRCLPKPIDYPRVRPNLDETHKNIRKRIGRHPEKNC
jgi:hypothetical protein